MKKKQQFKIGWLGFHQEGLYALNGILEKGYKVEAVITLDDESAQLRSGSVSYDSMCNNNDIRIFKIKNINEPNAIAMLHELDLDILFVIGWSQIVRKEAMNCVKIGLIGAHASLLPHNRGSAPVNWAIIKGENVTGNTLMWLKEDIDNGDIIAQRKFDITLYDTCNTIYEKVKISNRDMILEFLENSEMSIPVSIKQIDIDEPLLSRRRPHDGQVDWDQSARQIYDFIRALTKPYPGAFSYINGKKMLIWEAVLLELSVASDKAGEILGAAYSPNDSACGLIVSCQQGVIIILSMEDESGTSYHGESLVELDYKGLGFHNEH